MRRIINQLHNGHSGRIRLHFVLSILASALLGLVYAFFEGRVGAVYGKNVLGSSLIIFFSFWLIMLTVLWVNDGFKKSGD